MKKLITLLMFSLIGITQTWAWSDMYLLNSEDDNWTSNLTIRPRPVALLHKIIF